MAYRPAIGLFFEATPQRSYVLLHTAFLISYPKRSTANFIAPF